VLSDVVNPFVEVWLLTLRRPMISSFVQLRPIMYSLVECINPLEECAVNQLRFDPYSQPEFFIFHLPKFNPHLFYSCEYLLLPLTLEMIICLYPFINEPLFFLNHHGYVSVKISPSIECFLLIGYYITLWETVVLDRFVDNLSESKESTFLLSFLVRSLKWFLRLLWL
jgi:hypothetical protein